MGNILTKIDTFNLDLHRNRRKYAEMAKNMNLEYSILQIKRTNKGRYKYGRGDLPSVYAYMCHQIRFFRHNEGI
jgi:hypothetical protein